LRPTVAVVSANIALMPWTPPFHCAFSSAHLDSCMGNLLNCPCLVPVTCSSVPETSARMRLSMDAAKPRCAAPTFPQQPHRWSARKAIALPTGRHKAEVAAASPDPPLVSDNVCCGPSWWMAASAVFTLPFRGFAALCVPMRAAGRLFSAYDGSVGQPNSTQLPEFWSTHRWKALDLASFLVGF